MRSSTSIKTGVGPSGLIRLGHVPIRQAAVPGSSILYRCRVAAVHNDDAGRWSRGYRFGLASAGVGHDCSVPDCAVPHCSNPATKGEDWKNPHEPLVVHRLGVELRLMVRDKAVVLTLCDEHAIELALAAWQPVLDKLGEWNWKPL